jgi:hypothetical protein
MAASLGPKGSAESMSYSPVGLMHSCNPVSFSVFKQAFAAFILLTHMVKTGTRSTCVPATVSLQGL